MKRKRLLFAKNISNFEIEKSKNMLHTLVTYFLTPRTIC